MKEVATLSAPTENTLVLLSVSDTQRHVVFRTGVWEAWVESRIFNQGSGRAGGSRSASHSLLPSGDQFVLLQSGKKGPPLLLLGQSCEFYSLHLVPGGITAPT